MYLLILKPFIQMIFNYNKEYLEKYVEIYQVEIVNGKQEIVHKHVRKSDVISNLEKILVLEDKVQTSEKNRYPAISSYNNITSIEQAVRNTNESRTVFREYLGQNILGMYDPSTDTVYIKSGMDSLITAWVKEHEYAHRRRAHTGESQDEQLVDYEASAIIGFNPFGNRFYRNVA